MDPDVEFWIIAILLFGIMILLGIVVQRLTTLVVLFRGSPRIQPIPSERQTL
jgi:hypothetical protein